MNFTITPLPSDIARRVRDTRLDGQGNEISERFDDHPHQCRSCLELTAPGEGYLALSYRPFATSHPFAECGPIYLHARECTPYAARQQYPPQFPREAVVLRAYGDNHEIRDARYVGRTPVEEVIAELFRDEEIAYLHARNSTYGCFMFRVDRA